MTLVIVLRFLLANQKNGVIKNVHALYRDNGPLINLFCLYSSIQCFEQTEDVEIGQ